MVSGGQIRHAQDRRLDQALWQQPEMRAALAGRDIAVVFRLMQRAGVTQRRIASLTGQSQSEISEILGGRQVVSYDVLTRIADGLGVPRGRLGLAYDDATAALVADAEPDDDDPNRLIARLAGLTVGTITVDAATWAQPFTPAWTTAPENIGLSDVARLTGITGQLRAIDREYGGSVCRDAVVAQVAWSQQLLRAHSGDTVAHALHVAVADLHLLAGWTSFDAGMPGPARRHFARALEHARFIDEPSLVAKALYCLGRLNLHHRWTPQALRLFQLGLFSAQQSGHGRAVAMLHANEAWAHALLGETRQTMACVGRAGDDFAHADAGHTPAWLEFFDTTELRALRATAIANLPDATTPQRGDAIEQLIRASASRDQTMNRSRTFELITLATLLFAGGRVDQALRVGEQATAFAARLRSSRITDRLELLARVATRHHGRGDVRDLTAAIGQLRGGVAAT